MEIPTFVVVGHPNEGKSSVVSTLTENDSIMVTATPGETRNIEEFPIKIDGKVVLKFIDTPGFQHPAGILRWFRKYEKENNSSVNITGDFIAEFEDNKKYDHDIKLLRPVNNGAIIIFVVDASRPLRKHDRQEMEILRMTGQPRMAIINSKTTDNEYLQDWQHELLKHYNIVHEFNAHKASFNERIKMLEALRVMNRDWEQEITTAIDALKTDWQARLAKTADEICIMLDRVASCKESATLNEDKYDKKELEEKLIERYKNEIIKREEKCHAAIRKIFRHKLFQGKLESDIAFGENDLFSGETWKVLGLSRNQFAAAAAVAGGGAGAGIDVLLPGITFGVFAAGGALVAGGAAYFEAQKISNFKIKKNLLSLRFGGRKIQIGPIKKNSQLIYILVDRALLYFETVSNWAHARRQQDTFIIPLHSKNIPLTRDWSKEDRNMLYRYINGKIKREELCDILTDKMSLS